LEKELIVITGRNENLPGKPLVYGTSKNFMDYFGLNSTDDLPKIKEVLAEQLVEPTIVNPDHSKTIDDEESLLSVDSNGDLVLKTEANENTPDENANDESQNESGSEENSDKEI
jgi:segregation and condensation protein B